MLPSRRAHLQGLEAVLQPPAGTASWLKLALLLSGEDIHRHLQHLVRYGPCLLSRQDPATARTTCLATCRAAVRAGLSSRRRSRLNHRMTTSSCMRGGLVLGRHAALAAAPPAQTALRKSQSSTQRKQVACVQIRTVTAAIYSAAGMWDRCAVSLSRQGKQGLT